MCSSEEISRKMSSNASGIINSRQTVLGAAVAVRLAGFARYAVSLCDGRGRDEVILESSGPGSRFDSPAQLPA